ncbi:hypothetical protein [Roseiconus lacunae]|uniref:Uncharacterized protein n=1 Tax=Roseiconus lacunae TaxID=2605694 RepID=A0ABT7PFK8_9BACT|nr:hypothetical protein [Roseiconus lacunae]MDM4015277.1 hypothetical protein [Roseiconus lacunae]
MPSILEQVDELVASDQQLHDENLADAKNEMIEIACREFAGKSAPQDASSLAAIFDDTGFTSDDYQSLLNQIGQVVKASAKLKFATEKSSPDARASAKCEEYKAQLAVDLASRRTRRVKSYEHDRVTAQSRLDAVKQNWPELFGDDGTLKPVIAAGVPAAVRKEQKSDRDREAEFIADQQRSLAAFCKRQNIKSEAE